MAANNLTGTDSQVLERIFNPECLDAHLTDKIGEEEQFESADEKAARALEIEAIRAAEADDTETAMAKFNEATKVAPQWASTYNNRAQLFQLLGKIEEALADLDKTIELTHGQGHVASLAFTQRAIIRRVKKDEFGAESDFRAAANLGNPFAKSELVKMNPCAALCGQMLHDMFAKVRDGKANFN